MGNTCLIKGAVIMPVEQNRKRFLLLYGSQTGQAEAITEEIADNAASHGFTCDRFCLGLTEKKFNIERESCVVFVTSTTGDGDPPDTAQKFFRRLKKKTMPDTYLAHLNYTLLGLGDSNYTNFCNAGKTLDRRLEELGAKRFYSCGWADDAVGLEVMVEPWMESLWPALQKHFNVSYSDKADVCDKCDYDISTSVPESSPSNVNDKQTHQEKVNSTPQDTSGTNNASLPAHLSDQINNGPSPDVKQSHSQQTAGPTSDIPINSENVNKAINTEPVTDGELSLVTKGTVRSSSDASASVNGAVRTETNTSSTDSDISQNSQPVNKEQTQNKVDAIATESTLIKSVSPLSEATLTVPALPPAYLTVEFKPSTSVDVKNIPLQNGASFPSAATPVTMATVKSATILTTEDAVKKTICLRMKVEENSLKYLPGDAVSICCTNDEQEVDRLLRRFGVADKAEDTCEINVMSETKKKNPSIPAYLPPCCTLRHLFSTCIDIRETPKKAALRALVEYTSDQSEKRRLQELCSKQGASDYTKHLRDPALSILDILEAFPSCHPPIATMLEILPRLQPRPYSICSSPLSDPHELEVAFNVIEIPDGEFLSRRQGVCTGMIDRLTKDIQCRGGTTDMMAKLSINTTPIQIPIFGRTNQKFHVPEDLTIPIILIGPGTGVAPFVGFLRHRESLLSSGQLPDNYGDTWLFFGCRHKERDYLYRETLEDFHSRGIITRLHVCFSRDEQPADAPRYVQHNILRNSNDLVELIDNRKAVVFVCGDAKNMARDVNEAFMSALREQKGINEADARSYVMQMRLHRQYMEDVWT